MFLHFTLKVGYNSRKFGMTLCGRNYITCRSVLTAASREKRRQFIKQHNVQYQIKCKEGILHKVDISEPIEWLNSFVCVKKSNGKIRLCLDLMHLNKWIIRPRHSAKLVDDILHRLNGAMYFTVVDSTSSFFNHKLDEESSRLTTFGTPFGRYRYLRMPMGASLKRCIPVQSG